MPKALTPERIFQLVALVLAAAAAYFFLKDNSDWAFGFAVFAICSAFLGYRFRLKERVNKGVIEEDEG